MTISFKVSDSTKEKLTEFYEDLKRDKTPDYAVFQAKDGDSVVTLYESGKIVFQGRDADLASDFWIATEKQVSKNLLVNNSDKKKKDKKDIYIDPKIYNSTSIGSDEVGTGDYFGPIVVTGAYVKKEDIPFLQELGVTDSKKLDDLKILQIVPELIKRIPYTTFILSNEKYNEMSSKMNMNQIKAVLHNKVLVDLTSKYKYDYVVVDEFAKANNYYNYLKEVPKVCHDITFLTKGETKCLSVACASVISRYVFIKEFKKIEDSVSCHLPKGASTSVDEAASLIVKKYGYEKLEKIAKMNFKNTEKVKKIIG
jgi:ribonuclease HIII